ncbi:MAG TPA: CPBP family intramembrane glutamic endopeptidase [Thermoanaerobaculia bacterium]|nr:CPBP family intramembrane glutamic endopeptidase [Thermoanaerobaculia bacterium]
MTDPLTHPEPAAVSKARFLLAGLLQLLVAAVCLVGAVALYRGLVDPWIDSVFSLGAPTASLVRRCGVFLAIVGSYWAFVRLYERRAVSELMLRWRWILLTAAAGSLSIGVTILVLYATGRYELVAYRGFAQAGGVLAQIGVAAVLEEVAFRGILFRLLETRLGTLAALVGSSVVFMVSHLANGGVRPVTALTVTLAGLLWALLFVLSRNLWVAAAHHCCWNATIFLVGVPLSGVEEWRALAPLATVDHGPRLWTGGGFGPEDSLVNLVVMTVLCLALWRLARRATAPTAPPASVSSPPPSPA